MINDGQRLMTAVRLATFDAHSEKKGFVPCPKCGGKFVYTWTEGQGLVGACETPDCLKWPIKDAQ